MEKCNICELYDYADSFWREEICKVFSPMLHIHHVPIRITNKIKGHVGICEFNKLGTQKEYCMVTVSTDGYSDEEIKQIIRHELIHLSLGLMNLKSDDGCAVFKFLCDLYDANFYGEMNEIECEIHSFYKEYFEKGVTICKNNPRCWCLFEEVIKLIGDKDITSKSMIGSKKGTVPLVFDVMKILKEK